MGLQHLRTATETVETSGGDFTVRGLSFADITVVVRENAGLADLFTRFVKSAQGGDLVMADMASMAVHLVDAAPQAVAQIIALAANEEDYTLAADFPFPVQIEALEKIGRLTFGTEADAGKKALDTVVRAARAIRAAMTGPKP